MPNTHTPARSSPARKLITKPTKGLEHTEPKPKSNEKLRPLHPKNNSDEPARPNHAEPSNPSSRQNWNRELSGTRTKTRNRNPKQNRPDANNASSHPRPTTCPYLRKRAIPTPTFKHLPEHRTLETQVDFAHPFPQTFRPTSACTGPCAGACTGFSVY
ncbi:hypothetical protein ATANTOWER_028091 [Ataeniobius toweri]|uniref:Uncharacterized protein n=1 Tax=Ataeniobius toweri TaxID=208326 RepID=A0ABU7BSR4_9TELE|nr:hypothetical protein [Ataeniobius toweri]